MTYHGQFSHVPGRERLVIGPARKKRLVWPARVLSSNFTRKPLNKNRKAWNSTRHEPPPSKSQLCVVRFAKSTPPHTAKNFPNPSLDNLSSPPQVWFGSYMPFLFTISISGSMTPSKMRDVTLIQEDLIWMRQFMIRK